MNDQDDATPVLGYSSPGGLDAMVIAVLLIRSSALVVLSGLVYEVGYVADAEFTYEAIMTYGWRGILVRSLCFLLGAGAMWIYAPALSRAALHFRR